MPRLIISNKHAIGFEMEISDPVPPDAGALIAASGLFDRVQIYGSECPESNVDLGGADMVRAARRVLEREGRRS